MPLRHLNAGDEVAILSGPNFPQYDVLEIVKVAYAGVVLVEVEDGRRYSHLGYGLNAESTGVIVPATDEHRAALAQRSSTSPQPA